MLGPRKLPRLTCIGLLVSVLFLLPPLSTASANQPLPAAPAGVGQGDTGGSPAQHGTVDRGLWGELFPNILPTQNRQPDRMSLDFNLGIAGFRNRSEAGDPFPVALVSLGYRKYVAAQWGFHLRGGAMLGKFWRRESGDPGPDGRDVDTSILTGASADGLVVFQPFVTRGGVALFVGPALCLHYLHLTNTTLHNVYPSVHLNDGITAGGGFDAGGLFGPENQGVAYTSLRITDGVGESMIFLFLGVGYLM